MPFTRAFYCPLDDAVFNEANRKEIEQGFLRERSKAIDLIAILASKRYRTVEGAEYGKHGLGRRILILHHCVGSVFSVLPLFASKPRRHELLEATVHAQAFSINLVGALDNLARLWLFETGALPDTSFPQSHIGLGPKYKRVRSTLPLPFREHVETFDEWFGYVEGYRHALAHRIPLYIPNRRYLPEEAKARAALERQLWKAAIEHRFEDVERIEDEMHELGIFEPWMMHSFHEQSEPVAFHPQLICDLASVLDLTEKLLPHLE